MKEQKEKIIKRKEEQGITLIALVITIVILIILATVTLNVVLGEGGLIDRAQQAKELTEQAELEEQEGLNSLMDQMTNIMSEEQTPPTPTTPETDSKYFSFTFDEENKTASITGINEAYKSEDGVIVDGDTRITSIVIPGSVKNSGEDYTVTSVASGSFMECALEEVTIPDSVTVINGYAFSLCTALTKLTIGSGVTIIGSNAFSNCTALEEVTIPDSVTEIGGSAFPGCTALKKLTIGSGVTKIGGSAFAMCTTLEEIIYLGLSAPTFETNVFYNVSVKYVQVPKEYEDSTFGRFSIMRLD